MLQVHTLPADIFGLPGISILHIFAYITSDPLNGIGFACVCIIFRCVYVIVFALICRLSLGSVTLDVAMGTPCGFLQQLVTVQLDHKVPEMVVLGQLSHRLVCTPDLETLFSSGSTKR